MNQGQSRLSAVAEFTAFFSRQMPLATLLDEAPARIARILACDVCSLYVREGDGNALVMRGNIGFNTKAIGSVQLHVGEGLTGRAVATAKPVRALRAANETGYKHFDDLGEEQYPSFLAVPIPGRTSALGALVAQRREGAFSDAEVELLLLLGALIAASLRTADLLDERRERPTRKAGGGTRKVTLTGRPIVAGRALGAAAALRRPAQRPSTRIALDQGAHDRALLKGAFDVAEKALRALLTRAQAANLGKSAAFLNTYLEIAGDGRFHERALELARELGSIPAALSQVGREVTRTAASVTRDPFLEERAKDVEDLCDAISMMAASDKRAELPNRAILVGDGLTVFDLLVSARAHPVGVVLTERATSPRTHALLTLLDVPAIAGVEGLFRWISDVDIVVLNADHGLIVVNPSKSEVAALRQKRRDEGSGSDAPKPLS
jgi:phosphotransferase system, enzyme I, PtsP